MSIIYETNLGLAYGDCDLSSCNQITIGFPWGGCSLPPECKHSCDKDKHFIARNIMIITY